MRRVLWLAGWLLGCLAATTADAQTTTYTNLTVAPFFAAYGQLVLFQVQVRPWCDGCGAPLPTGTVAFSVDGASAGSGMLYNSSTRTFGTNIGPGNHVVVANYSGDASNAPSASSEAQLTVYPAGTSLSLAAAATGSVGQALTAFTTVFVQAPGGGVPTGEIVVTDGIGDSCTVELPATSCALTPTAPGSLTLVAKYSGSATHSPSTATSLATIGGPSRSVAGDVDNLLGSGLVLHLDFAGGAEDLVVPAGAAGFGFSSALGTGSFYNVTVATQPAGPRQGCSVANGAGVIQGDVVNVAVHCVTDAYTVGGIVSGLAGSGLMLQINGGGDIAIGADGGFAFPPIPDGSAYAVTVAAQPSAPAQQCTVRRGAGTLSGHPVSDVLVTCASVFTVGGSVGALDGTLALQLNGGETLLLEPGGPRPFAFTTLLSSGSGYAVTVSMPPPGTSCQVTNGHGTIIGGNVDNVIVECEHDNPVALSLAVDDGTAYARYGDTTHYIVELVNAGAGTVSGIIVMGSPSPGLDDGSAHWQCTASGGATCTSGDGGFFTMADLPPGSSATWIVDMPINQQAPDNTVTFDVSAAGAASVRDTDTLVVFRDGFEG